MSTQETPAVKVSPVQLIRQSCLRLGPHDDVVIAARPLSAGTAIEDGTVLVSQAIAPGHKVAVQAVAKGQPVKRYGQVIGFATQDITPGEHVHSHNLAFNTFERDYAIGKDLKALALPKTPATFQGYVRADGRVATRNYIGVISTVNCSASVSKYVAQHFDAGALAAYPNVDGVVPITHSTGCGMDSNGEGIDVLRRTIAGYARHANFAGVVIIGLGCEANQMDALFAAQQLEDGGLLKPLVVQTEGGTRKTVEAGIAAVKQMLPQANQTQRTTVPASHLKIGLQCGGSDGYSGITANPALGAACDLVVAHGGTVILSETPEIYGAEHLLTRRAISHQVAQRLIDRIRWWEGYTEKNNGSMDNNPSPGNKAGGLTTILEKSLGAVAKGGTTNLVDVVDYAMPVGTPGLVFMDTPGYDPVSATGQVAGGANMICFTTGRGSVYGCKPAPSIKLATNSLLYARMPEDMDINCGDIVDQGVSVATKGEEIFALMLRVASGEPTKSEALGIGNDEFVPWQLGAVM
jgi:altronate hydrolase